jgi:HEAT repeat protein
MEKPMYRLLLVAGVLWLAGCGLGQMKPLPMPGAARELSWEEEFGKNRLHEPHGPPTYGSAESNENFLQSFLITVAYEVGRENVVQALQKYMRGEVPRAEARSYRVLAAVALIRRDTDTDEALQVLVGALQGEDEWAARYSAQMLPRLAPASIAALPALAKASNRPDQGAQSAGLAAADFGLPAVPHLIVALREQDPNKPLGNLWTSYGLEKIGPLAVPALIEALQDENESVRFGACYALGQIGLKSASAGPALIPLLSDPHASVRSVTATSLQRMNCRSNEVISALLAARKDADDKVRGSVATALGVLGKEDERVSPALVELIQDPAPRVCRIAAHSLGELGPAAKEAWPKLHEVFRGADEQDQYMLAEALVRIDAEAAERHGLRMQTLSRFPVRISPPGE